MKFLFPLTLSSDRVLSGDTSWLQDECEEIKSAECPAGYVYISVVKDLFPVPHVTMCQKEPSHSNYLLFFLIPKSCCVFPLLNLFLPHMPHIWMICVQVCASTAHHTVSGWISSFLRKERKQCHTQHRETQ